MSFAIGSKIRCLEHTSSKRGGVDFFMRVGVIVGRMASRSMTGREPSIRAKFIFPCDQLNGQLIEDYGIFYEEEVRELSLPEILAELVHGDR